MTQEDILRMAQEAGLAIVYSERDEDGWLELERFAALVAAAEREACATACEDTTAAWTQPVYNGACMDCAAAIRARGNK